MTRRKKGERRFGTCTYCRLDAELSRDHVIPLGLFQRPYPPNLITVPACDECNQKKKGGLDGYLRDMVVMDVQAYGSPHARALWKGPVLRSFRRNSSVVARAAIVTGEVKPFYTPGGLFVGDLPQFRLDATRIIEAFAYVVRGLSYDRRRVRIPFDRETVVRRVRPWHHQGVLDMLAVQPFSNPVALGEVFWFRFAEVEEDPNVTAWLLSFFDRVTFWVVTMPTSPACEPTS